MTRPPRRRASPAAAAAVALLPLLVVASAGGCIAPSLLDASARLPDAAVTSDFATVKWHPVDVASLLGLWRSAAIEGEAAGTLLQVDYLFDRGGRYSGAALVATAAGPAFQTLAGTFALLPSGELDLGDGEVVAVASADDLLRLSSAGGSVILRRVPLD